MGGGFGVGIHNVLEAAVWGIPVIFGPNNKRFQEARDLLAAKGGFEIYDNEGFQRIITRLITDDEFLKASSEKAGNFVASHSGATEEILKLTS